jgi:hypothetical protein
MAELMTSGNRQKTIVKNEDSKENVPGPLASGGICRDLRYIYYDFVLQGTVLYLVHLHLVQLFTLRTILSTSFPQGISDSPAWLVSKVNQYAKDHGKTPFCIYQGNWSIPEQSFERDSIMMAHSGGLALAPWGVLGGGKIRSNA